MKKCFQESPADLLEVRKENEENKFLKTDKFKFLNMVDLSIKNLVWIMMPYVNCMDSKCKSIKSCIKYSSLYSVMIG